MKQSIQLFQVDAFAGRLFSGNPAAICPLQDWLSDELMQSIAAENNLAETAFIIRRDERVEIRWFTPGVEVDLCGHATLAAAYVLFHCLGYKGDIIPFYSPRSGALSVSRADDYLFLDFPTDQLSKVEAPALIEQGIGLKPLEVYKGLSDYIAIVDSETDVRSIVPNLSAIEQLDARGLGVTARGNEVDFVSRFFAPQSGIDEDPVTGSLHTSLIPIWSEKLGKKEMKALQVSRRLGELLCTDQGDRCRIGGQAQLFLKGEILLP